MSTDFNYTPILTNADGTPYELDVYGDPEAALARVEAKVDALDAKLTAVLEQVTVIVEQAKPALEQVMNSPIMAMITGGKKRG